MPAVAAAPMPAKEELPGEKVDSRKAPKDAVKEDAEAKAKAETKPDVGDDDDADEGDDLVPEAKPTFQRNEVGKGELKYRHDAVHVYGLDFLKTEHMNEIFSQFDHRYIEWINDSSANIIFRQRESAKKALESLSYPKVGDAPWRRTPDILVNDDCPPVFLQMRLATSTDVKKGKHAMPKIQSEDSKVVGRRNRQGIGDGPIKAYRDGMTTHLLEQAGLLFGKRKSEEPLTEEEVAKRQKRTTRFETDEAAKAQLAAAVAAAAAATHAPGAAPSPEVSTTAEPARKSTPIVNIERTVEATMEEVARRKKRAARFAEEEAAKEKAAKEKAAKTTG